MTTGLRGGRAWATSALAALALLVAPARAAADSGAIRVALVESARAVEVRGLEVELTLLATADGQEVARCEGCRGWSWRADVVHARMQGPTLEVNGRLVGAGVRLRSEGPLRLNGREYLGLIDLVRHGEGVAVVNELPLEDYLVGVLRAEAGEGWPGEMLRAQAVAARTYAAYQRGLSWGKPFHIIASTAHQGYAGRVAATSPLWAAVRETAGQVLLWEGELFPAFYHTESGGFTEDPRMVFAARNMPALKPVASPFSVGSPHYSWALDLRLADLSETLRRHGVAVGALRDVEVSERTPSLRAAAIVVRGSGGSARLRGNDFRRMIGYDILKSTLFAVAVDGEVVHFAGRGYGHGVGMCQWGAKGMAEQGYVAREILAFYYPGTAPGMLELRARAAP
ncbi:MAG TPA: SpoIID/LytB domain-containing protein [Vicinamibacteria bacterium]|nr:SpoIID/LytB domain-containing protein [Vicinamibacteria bacterium]